MKQEQAKEEEEALAKLERHTESREAIEMQQNHGAEGSKVQPAVKSAETNEIGAQSRPKSSRSEGGGPHHAATSSEAVDAKLHSKAAVQAEHVKIVNNGNGEDAHPHPTAKIVSETHQTQKPAQSSVSMVKADSNSGNAKTRTQMHVDAKPALGIDNLREQASKEMAALTVLPPSSFELQDACIYIYIYVYVYIYIYIYTHIYIYIYSYNTYIQAYTCWFSHLFT
jgi:hypothetical protein